jgi:hypothetical protein
LARFHNPTGSVLASQEFGLLPPGEFEVQGYDPEVHGVIPGCTWLDAPEPEPADGDDGEAGSPEGPPPAGTPKAGKRGPAAKDKEAAG